jgi:tetratricopeptide (TPR) repeat protein
MNQVRNLLLAFTLLGLFTFSGCNSLKKMVKMAEDQQLTVEPSPLEVHAGQVEFEMSAVLPVKMLKKDKVYTLNTFYQYGEERVEAGSLEFRAEDFPQGAEQQPRKSETFNFEYTDEAMDDGYLYVQGVASDPNSGDSESTPELQVAEGLITTSQLVQVPAAMGVLYADHGYNTGEELEPTYVAFYFDQGSARLKPSEVRSDRGERFRNFIAEKNVTRSVTITGTHSPEGPERVNEDLSQNRAERIEEYYRDQMDRYDYAETADEINFILKPVVEDWSGLRQMLQDYDGLTQSEKQEYFDIIDGPGSFEEKEDRMHQLPTYNEVFREIYPELRAARTEVLTVKEKKTPAQISVLSKQVAEDAVDSDTLNQLELMYGATLTPSLEEKAAIYEKAVELYNNWEAHNNLGAVYLQMAAEASESEMEDMLGQAQNQLEQAVRMNDNAESHANLAIIYALQGNSEKALDEITRASEMQPTMQESSAGIAAVKGAVEIMVADYEAAVSSLSNANETADNLFNLGLAQILTENYENAITSFEEALQMESDFAHAHYGIAIANARLQNESAVYDALENAVQDEADLREKAVTDLEFRNYDDTEQFRQALQ